MKILDFFQVIGILAVFAIGVIFIMTGSRKEEGK